MDELSKILTEATRSIEPGYFRLNIEGGDPVYRERVYCYELYHQMRLKWPEGCAFYLNGEIDKAAHPILSKLGAGYAKPDLLVHRPGYMSGNHAIMRSSLPAPRHPVSRRISPRCPYSGMRCGMSAASTSFTEIASTRCFGEFGERLLQLRTWPPLSCGFTSAQAIPPSKASF